MSDHGQLSREDRDFRKRFTKMFADTNAESLEAILNRIAARMKSFRGSISKAIDSAKRTESLHKRSLPAKNLFEDHLLIVDQILNGIKAINKNCEKCDRAQVDAERMQSVGNRTIN